MRDDVQYLVVSTGLARLPLPPAVVIGGNTFSMNIKYIPVVLSDMIICI